MDSLQHILGKRDFTPPSEVELIKEYIKRRYKSGCSVQVGQNNITINVRSSSLASTLRLEQRRLIEACNLKKKLIIRIS